MYLDGWFMTGLLLPHQAGALPCSILHPRMIAASTGGIINAIKTLLTYCSAGPLEKETSWREEEQIQRMAIKAHPK